ncbi:MAG: flagellar motor switch protein FliG, partial [Desulfobulbaceae bacterium]|nr:flagellar motor switch protein FliG [Desulfobulbaceae bacterium]
MAKKKEAASTNLTGPEKAAIFMLTLGEEFTSQVFKRLDEEDIKTVGRQMAKIDHVDKDDVAALLAELKTDVGSEDLYLSGNDMLEQ